MFYGKTSVHINRFASIYLTSECFDIFIPIFRHIYLKTNELKGTHCFCPINTKIRKQKLNRFSHLTRICFKQSRITEFFLFFCIKNILIKRYLTYKQRILIKQYTYSSIFTKCSFVKFTNKM